MSQMIQQQADRIPREYAAFERIAVRRERLLDALDWRCFDQQFIRETPMADTAVHDKLAEMWLHLGHLERWLCNPSIVAAAIG